jgi:hypothetical protein
MRFLTAMGKLMLGTPMHAAPLVSTTFAPVSPFNPRSCDPDITQTMASVPIVSLVVEIGG